MIGKIVDRDNWWHFIDMPVGPQPIPTWCKGLHVDWMMGYGNPPELRAKAGENPWNWPGMRWRREGDLYITQHPDGRAQFHQHDGRLSMQKLKTYRGVDAEKKPLKGVRLKLGRYRFRVWLTGWEVDNGLVGRTYQFPWSPYR